MSREVLRRACGVSSIVQIDNAWRISINFYRNGIIWSRNGLRSLAVAETEEPNHEESRLPAPSLFAFFAASLGK